MREYKAKDYALRIWLVENLFSMREVPWDTTKTGILMSEFTVEGWI